jgi:SanA protein
MGPRARLAKHMARWALVGVAGLIVFAALFTLAVNLLILHETRPFIVNEPAAVPPASVVIVPSGSLRPDGIPTSLAVDRIETAVGLYREGKVRALYLSGYPEQVRFMVAYAKANGVPQRDILADPAG